MKKIPDLHGSFNEEHEWKIRKFRKLKTELVLQRRGELKNYEIFNLHGIEHGEATISTIETREREFGL